MMSNMRWFSVVCVCAPYKRPDPWQLWPTNMIISLAVWGFFIRCFFFKYSDFQQILPRNSKHGTLKITHQKRKTSFLDATLVFGGGKSIQPNLVADIDRRWMLFRWSTATKRLVFLWSAVYWLHNFMNVSNASWIHLAYTSVQWEDVHVAKCVDIKHH